MRGRVCAQYGVRCSLLWEPWRRSDASSKRQVPRPSSFVKDVLGKFRELTIVSQRVHKDGISTEICHEQKLTVWCDRDT